MITSLVVDTGTTYLVIASESFGDFTPAASTGAMKVWLSGYKLYCRVLMYANNATTPEIATLELDADATGIAKFNVNTVIKDYFKRDISKLAKEIPGGVTLAQDAHGISAMFYRVWITEVYDLPGTPQTAQDPFDGLHNIYFDETTDLATIRVAVNGVHPFAGERLNWTTAGMGSHQVDTANNFIQRYMTDAPEKLIGGSLGRSRLSPLPSPARASARPFVPNRLGPSRCSSPLKLLLLRASSVPHRPRHRRRPASRPIRSSAATACPLLSIPRKLRSR